MGKELEDAIEHVEYYRPDGLKERMAMSCLTVSISELGTFLQTDNDQHVSTLVRLWDGQLDTFRHHTKASGKIEIQNPWLNLIAATTPAWLKENFPEDMIGGGLASRIVFVYGDKKRNLIPYPDEIIPGPTKAKLKDDLIADLIDISKIVGEYKLSGFARDFGRGWYTDHNNPDLRAAYLSSDRYNGYLARKQTHLHKLALVLAAAKRDKLLIEEDDLTEAEQIITDNEKAMLRVFESIGISPQAKYVKEIVSIVRFFDHMTSKDLWSKCMNSMNMKDFKEAVKAAFEGGLLESYGNGEVTCTQIGKKGT